MDDYEFVEQLTPDALRDMLKPDLIKPKPALEEFKDELTIELGGQAPTISPKEGLLSEMRTEAAPRRWLQLRWTEPAR